MEVLQEWGTGMGTRLWLLGSEARRRRDRPGPSSTPCSIDHRMYRMLSSHCRLHSTFCRSRIPIQATP